MMDKKPARDGKKKIGRRILLMAALVLFCAAVAAYVFLGSFIGLQKKRIAALERAVAAISANTVPLRFMVVSRGPDSIDLRLRLYDLAGREIGMTEESLPGGELYIDFALVPFESEDGSKRWLAFPAKIFTDSLPAASGISLYGLYDRDGFPALFEGAQLGRRERSALRELFAGLRDPSAAGDEGGFGSAVHDIRGLASFVEGRVYKILCRSKGGIEITED